MPYLKSIKIFDAKEENVHGDEFVVGEKRFPFADQIGPTLTVDLVNVAINAAQHMQRDFEITVIKKKNENKYVFIVDQEPAPLIEVVKSL